MNTLDLDEADPWGKVKMMCDNLDPQIKQENPEQQLLDEIQSLRAQLAALQESHDNWRDGALDFKAQLAAAKLQEGQTMIPDTDDSHKNLIDIGDGHQIELVAYEGDPYAGINEYHKTPDGLPCKGFLTITNGAWHKAFNGSIVSWEMVSKEPLTLTPSILCRRCGSHGYITNGRWVPA